MMAGRGQSRGANVLLTLRLLSAFDSGHCYGRQSNRHITSVFDVLPRDASSYDKAVPPTDNGQPVTVSLHVTVLSISAVDEGSMTYDADIFLVQTWRDHRLRIPKNKDEQFRAVDVEWLDHIWQPDSIFKNAKEEKFKTVPVPNRVLWLFQDGTLALMVKVTLTLSCPMNFAMYPHDTQYCRLQMESLSHTTSDLVFTWDENKALRVMEGIDLPVYGVADIRTTDCSTVYTTGNYTCQEVVFQLNRRLGHFLLCTYIPACIIVMLSWLSFWLGPEMALTRMIVALASLLTMLAISLLSQAAVPIASYIKAIDVFLSSCTMFVLLAFVESVLVRLLLRGNEIYEDPKRFTPPPYFDGSKISSTTFLSIGQIPSEATKDSENLCKKKNSFKALERFAHAVMMDRSCRCCFPVAFCVLNCVYWIIVRHSM